ncbi:PLDc N-terminal domain-containing protein, partial [Leucobacter sp. M11]|uniref:PLDc N-terminal domain-containing protein n=1 Tax=Leucobacter sp. M11 TaxID=2993565 RepID=UPI002D807F60
MARLIIIGVVVGVAFTLYSLVDAAMSDPRRARGVAKPIWVVIIVVLPVIGGILWFLIGRGQPQPEGAQLAPDDDPRFTGNTLSQRDVDRTLRDLEQQLAALDEETFPGEPQRAATDAPSAPEAPRAETGGGPADAAAPEASTEAP